ncbi:MAG: PASTA domain-containing protein [Coriobacteriia bacterium]|nr:PASTA domain-containing protein [Coriobacteriia bacterium]
MEETSYKRRSLVPKSAIIAGAVVTLLIAGAISASMSVYRSQLVTVPDLVLATISDAESRLEDVGLVGVVSGNRVSADVPENSVLSQDPVPGTLMPAGSEIRLVVSAGSQTVRVPDLVGVPVDEATAALTRAGFRIDERIASTEETRAVVLEMYPAPGTLVNIGDTIRMTVPGQSGESEVLLPFEMSGVSVLLDPAPSMGGESDPALEVGRRLASLLQASGAEATLTRLSATSDTTRGARIAVARESTATVFIGLETALGAGAGVTVLYRESGLAGADPTDPAALARSITSTLRLPGGRVNPPLPTGDPVLGGFPGDGVRLRLGDTGDEGDRSRFSDPSWADEVARSIYRALGAAYGTD